MKRLSTYQKVRRGSSSRNFVRRRNRPAQDRRLLRLEVLEGRHLLSNWELILPFVPATQSTVLWTGTGAAGIEGAPQSTEVFQGKIFYNVTQAGGANPTKVLAFDPGISLATEVLAVSSGQFNALKAMNGALYMAHTSGRLWKYDGVSVTELTQTPFSSTEYVTAMAEFQGSMFFGTWRDRVWRSADATVFVDTMADERSEIPLGPPWPQSNPKPISDLAVWKGHLYGCNYECYNYSAKVFRSGDGADWVVPLTTSTYGYMGFVEDAPDRLYVASVENAGGASFKIRTSKDGLAWEDVWYTSSENKNLYGSPEYFSQTDRAYFGMMWYGSMSIAPVRDDPTGPGSSLIEPRLPTPRKCNSLIEVDGRLFAIGPLDPSADPNTSPYAISLIGNYRPVGPTGDIKMLSATTEDSQSVTFTYEIVGSGISQFEVGVYRSDDLVFEPNEDQEVGSAALNGVTPGTHTATIPASLRIDPSRPYVLVIADPDDAIRETAEDNNSAFFQKYVIAVVTHGFQPLQTFPGWVTDMAESLRDPKKANYDGTIEFDWAASSNDPFPGRAVQQGVALASYVADFVRDLNILPDSAVDIHWIGHSRGAVVISQALSALETRTDLPEALDRGYMKMTMLDPHPSHNHLLPWFSTIPWPVPGWKVSAFLAVGTILFQAAAQDPEVTVPSIVDEAEVYYQNTLSLLTPSPPRNPADVLAEAFDFFLNLWGEVPITGAAEHDLTGFGMGHNDVHERYQDWLDGQAPLPLGSATTVTAGGVSASPDVLVSQAAVASAWGADDASAAAAQALEQEPDPEVDLLYPALVDDRAIAEQLVSYVGAAMAAYEDGTLRIAIDNLTALLELVQAQQGVHISLELAAYFGNFGQLVLDDWQQTAERTLPVIEPIDDQMADEGTTLSLAAVAGDPDPEDTLTFSLDAAPPGAVIDPVTGVFTWIPADGPATAQVTVRVTDSGTPPLSDTASFAVTVNNVPPVITSLCTSAMTPGSAGEGQTVTLAGTFTDAGVLDTHTATIDWGDGTTGAAVIEEAGGAGSLSGSHAYAAGGLYSIAVTVADDDGGTTSATTTAVITSAGVHDGVLQIVGTQGDDRVAVNMCSRDLIKVHASFFPKPGFEVFSAAGIQRIVILLGDGDDFATVSGDVTLTKVIDGGRGNDFLNGGGGSNILLGGDGWDMLIGGPRRDILIGGRGSDMLLGGAGDDILIGARTTMDSDDAPLAPGFDQALLAVLVEWNRETPYEERVGVLRSRIVALDDGAPDLLVGCAGRDWFFATLGTEKRDRILDRHFNEFVEPVA